jgi:hypothetical protein
MPKMVSLADLQAPFVAKPWEYIGDFSFNQEEHFMYLFAFLENGFLLLEYYWSDEITYPS